MGVGFSVGTRRIVSFVNRSPGDTQVINISVIAFEFLVRCFDERYLKYFDEFANLIFATLIIDSQYFEVLTKSSDTDQNFSLK